MMVKPTPLILYNLKHFQYVIKYLYKILNDLKHFQCFISNLFFHFNFCFFIKAFDFLKIHILVSQRLYSNDNCNIILLVLKFYLKGEKTLDNKI